MTDKIGKKRIGRIIAVVLLAMTLVVGLIPNQALAAESKIADEATIDKYLESLGDEASTEYAGRIWTDKTVFAEDTSIRMKPNDSTPADNHLDLKISKGSDFAVMYSALATGVEVTGSTVTPMDVVFVIDMSSSMSRESNRMDNGQLRVYNATVALNNAVKEILDINEYVRIGVVGYNRNAFTILPLDHYEQRTGYEFFTCSGGTITVNANGTGSNDYNNRTVSTNTGTNIQQGLFAGMNMLASTSSTTVDMNGMEVKRVPSVVLLTDGEPSVGSPDQEWWKPDASVSNSTSTMPDTIDGMKALMTGTYMKGEVNRHYGISGVNGMNLYSIGVGIEKVSDSYRPLAYATINPNDTTLRNNTNGAVGDMRTTWSRYANNQTATLGGYTFRHPGSNDIVGDKDISQLYYVDEYHSVEDAGAMTDAFESIVTSISVRAAESPTELKHADPSETGWIHYTDPIGKYMEVKAIKGIIYNGVYYPSTDGKVVTGIVENQLYAEEDLSDVEITIEGTAGVDQKLKIDIPASLIPIRINSVDLNADGSVKSHTNNGSWPIRVIYEVGLVESITTTDGSGDRVVDTAKLNAAYLQENTDTATGNVNFYSNLYTGQHVAGHTDHTAGNATVEFEPAHTNSFYYMQEPDPIYQLVGGNYVQVSGTAAADLQDGVTYYYISDYYHGTSVEKEYLARTKAQLERVEIVSIDGKLYRAAGSPRLNRILEFAGNKAVNTTETADDFYYPTFEHAPGNPDPAAGKYVVYLGNNGKLSIPAMGELAISKTVTAGEGLTAPDKEFTFTVDFNGAETLAGEFKYEITGGTTGTITDGGTLKLKAGQTAKITGLAPGTTYKVTEAAVAGFSQAVTGDTGTIEVGKTSEAVFRNHYDVEALIWPVDEELEAKKQIDGRSVWTADDNYTFQLASTDLSTPMPAGSTVVGTHMVKEYTITASTPDYEAVFGKINFTKPGVYEYTVSEKLPATGDYLPGITYSAAIYEIIVTVTDDGTGKLAADTTVTRVYNHQGEEVNETVSGMELTFINVYKADDTAWTPVGTKNYTDLSGSRPLADGMFEFRIQPIGTNAADAPMPAAGTAGTGADRYYIAKNTGSEIAYPQIHFTHSDAGKEFTYRFTEVVPTGSSKIPGMSYDTSEYEVKVAVSVDGSSHVKLDVTYPGSTSRVTFVNTYDPADAKAALAGEKIFSGEGFTPDATDFGFSVEAANDAAKTVLSGTATTKIEGMTKGTESFAFGEMTFEKTGTYIFHIKESIPGTAVENADGTYTLRGVTYDTHVTVATVTVTDDQGELKASISYNNGSVSDATDKAVFKNVYEPEPAVDATILTGTKTLLGKPLVAGEFFFEVHDQQTGKSYLVPHGADSDADGVASILFGETITFTKPGTYNYIIKEQIPVNPVPGNTYDTTEYQYTVVVTDDGKGKLEATSSLVALANTGNVGDTNISIANNAVNFVNTYKPEPLEVDISPMHKILEGARTNAGEGEFEFELSLVSAEPADGVELPAVTKVKNDADG